MKIMNPVIEQRADPHIYLHTDGYYYFTASVPEYDRIELRRSRELAELSTTNEIIRYHNSYVLFTAYLLMFATGPTHDHSLHKLIKSRSVERLQV